MFAYVKYFNMMESDDYVMYYIFKRYGEYLLNFLKNVVAKKKGKLVRLKKKKFYKNE